MRLLLSAAPFSALPLLGAAAAVSSLGYGGGRRRTKKHFSTSNWSLVPDKAPAVEELATGGGGTLSSSLPPTSTGRYGAQSLKSGRRERRGFSSLILCAHKNCWGRREKRAVALVVAFMTSTEKNLHKEEGEEQSTLSSASPLLLATCSKL